MSADWSEFGAKLVRPIASKQEQPALVPRQRKSLPTGSESQGPRLEWDGHQGEVTSRPMESPPGTWDELLIAWGLDPAEVEVVEPVRRSSWEVPYRDEDGELVTRVLSSFRARIQRRRVGGADIEALCEQIRTHTPHAPAPQGPLAFVIAPADAQLGKGPVEHLIARFMQATDAAASRLAELRTAGYEIGSIYILHGGDCIENTQGHYPAQPFTVTLGLTEQIRVYRRLMLHQVKVFAPLADRLVLAACNGNHGEIRNGSGKAFTKPSDNFDTEIASQVADILAENPLAYGHVSIAVPTAERLDVTLDIAGTSVTLTHGHQFRGKDGAMDWWAKQSHGLQPAGESVLMVSGHLHHLRVTQDGAKTHIQLPSLDVAGSDWWTNLTGQVAPTGMVSMLVGGGGYSHFDIH